ncbi:MAG: hypothetical protein WCQ44_12575, partial [Opitutaceae bacterium]
SAALSIAAGAWWSMERRDELLCQTLTAVLSVHFKLQPFAGTRKIPRSFKRPLHLPRRRLVFWPD